MSQAITAGAISVAEPGDQFYGNRFARITEGYGNQRFISAHIGA